jgi:hypothetical protein
VCEIYSWALSQETGSRRYQYADCRSSKHLDFDLRSII